MGSSHNLLSLFLSYLFSFYGLDKFSALSRTNLNNIKTSQHRLLYYAISNSVFTITWRVGAKLFIFAGIVGNDSSFSSLKIRINEPFCFRHRRHMYLKFNDISTYKYAYKTLLLNKYVVELGYYFHHFQFRDFTAFWRMVPVPSRSYCCFIHDYNREYWSL